MLIPWRLQGRSTIAWRHMSTATCRPMRISNRPKHSAVVFEFLTGQPEGQVEPRPHVLQADDCGELDKVGRIKMGPQPLHKLVVNGGRRRGHGLCVPCHVSLSHRLGFVRLERDFGKEWQSYKRRVRRSL